MTIHDLFTSDHQQLRRLVQELQKTLLEKPEQLEERFLSFQKAVRDHFRKEDEVYYTRIDAGKQVADRALMHNLRNDHAAVIFALESLAIRLRKKVPLPEWKMKFDTMIAVLLPHFDQEEQTLFPEVEGSVPSALLQKILDEVNALE